MVKKILDHKVTKITADIIKFKLQVILFLLLPLVVFTLVISKTEMIKEFNAFIVLTGSMEPTIPVGSIIYTKSQIAYDKNDVVSFKNAAEQTVTHRIADINYSVSTNYTTKGDANNTVDSTTVLPAHVIGKVYFQLPYVGYLMNFLRTTTGFLLVVILPITIFVLLEFWNIKKEMEKEIEKKMFARYQKQQSFGLQ